MHERILVFDLSCLSVCLYDSCRWYARCVVLETSGKMCST